MSIKLSAKSQKFIAKNNVHNLFIDLAYIEEPCVQIYEPKIKMIEDKNLGKFDEVNRISNESLTIFISDAFTKTYGKLDKYFLDRGGIVKKNLFLRNVDPIIKNICKTK